MARQPRIKPEHYGEIYDVFSAAISTRHDCGQFCAPLNDGVPHCCRTDGAIPLADKEEFQFLQTRSDLWHKFKPFDAESRKVVKDLHSSCVAIECKGVEHCERENRTIACRAFPFFPYITKEKKFVGLSYYWEFEDECWVISNMKIVQQSFLDEFSRGFEKLFLYDFESFDLFRDHSAAMRRVFTRWKRSFPVLGRDGKFFMVRPGDPTLRPVEQGKLRKFGPFRSETAYAKAVKEKKGVLPKRSVML
ncbi:MAG: hypothetical protein AB7G15_03750 [Alphaproteobacteria bacterium]